VNSGIGEGEVRQLRRCKAGTGCKGMQVQSKRVKVIPGSEDIFAPESSSGARGGVIALPPGQSPSAGFVERVCLPKLRSAQNGDGGWGYRPGSESRVEPTCWVLQALLNVAGMEVSSEACRRGLRFLRSAQLPDGSWPFAAGQQVGCSVTAPACWALLSGESSFQAVAAGLSWLSQDRPRDSVFWRRWLGRLSPARHRSRKNSAYRGWGWNPCTSSWVEPTAVALLVLSRCPKELLPAGANQRRQSAEAMLYDRMCPGGGWNCGDPLVYGVPGKPLVIPTAWALLALRRYPQRTENLVSLDWLERKLPDEQGPGSLALAQICLGAYGHKWPATAKSPEDLYSNHEFLGSTTTMAWVCLAANSRRSWLTGESGETLR